MRYKEKDEIKNEVISVRVPHHLRAKINLFSYIFKLNSVSDIVRIATSMINMEILFYFKNSNIFSENNFYKNKTIKFRLSENEKRKLANFIRHGFAGISDLVRFALNRFFSLATFKFTKILLKNLYLSLNQQIAIRQLQRIIYESCDIRTYNLLNFSFFFHKFYRRYPRLLV